MSRPDPLLIPWRGGTIRLRHDDPRLGLYTDVGKRLTAAVQLATDIDGLRIVLASNHGRGYRVRVSDDAQTVGLHRLT